MSTTVEPAEAGFLMDQLKDEDLVRLATEAQEWAEEAEGEAGSTNRWLMADSFLELSNRGWSQKSIGHTVGISQQNVSYYVQSAKTHHLGGNRPTFAFAYREAKGEKLDPLHSSESDEWETPQALYDLLDGEFGFELDVCATEENTKCKAFLDRETDGLSQLWLRSRMWMNPPYSQIDKWMAKAAEAAAEGKTVVCLVPARTDTTWWWNVARHGEVRFLRGRLKFGGCKNSAPFPSAVVVLGRTAAVKWWEAWPTA